MLSIQIERVRSCGRCVSVKAEPTEACNGEWQVTAIRFTPRRQTYAEVRRLIRILWIRGRNLRIRRSAEVSRRCALPLEKKFGSLLLSYAVRQQSLGAVPHSPRL